MNSIAKRCYVAGHQGMVGSAIVRKLEAMGHKRIITRTHSELDLTNQAAVESFFKQEKPEEVYLAAAKVGGIYANNTFPAEFIYQNIMIEANVIHAAHMHDVDNLLLLGSSCIYPKLAPQPMGEDALLTGKLEATNEPYALAKIAGIKLCESYNRQYGRDYRSVMPTNLYGPGDNFDLDNSHVLPAMIRKFHLAKLARQNDIEGILYDQERYGEITTEIREIIGYSSLDSKLFPKENMTFWGSGKVSREFLYVDDMAEACIFVMTLDKGVFESNTKPMLNHINVGYGSDISIRDAAKIVAEVVGYSGQIEFDNAMPDGAPKKLLDSSKLLKLGWNAKVDLKQGLHQTYTDYLKK